MRNEKKAFFDFSHLRYDLLGGITAGIVALPLALAFGEQSGLGAAAGLYGAAFLGFFAAVFGGTPTQISGPTAPMTALSMVIIAGLLQAFEGRIEQALPIILGVFLLSGLFQIVLGYLKLGTYVKFIPHPVVSGFMSGIGVIILITQILPAVGYYTDQDADVVKGFVPHAEELILDRILMEEAQDGVLVLETFKETITRADAVTPEDVEIEAVLLAANASKGVHGSLKYVGRAVQNINWMELALALLTIAIIYGSKLITKAVPGTLIALILVSGGAYLMGLDYVLINEIPMGFPDFHFGIITDFKLGAMAPYVLTAFMLALLGAIDSLLTSVVADNLTRTRHDPNRELVGQGLGNGIGAMFGGLPGAGATIRTVVNIHAGGRTKISGMTAGLLLLVILLVLGPIASKIPAAVLAGILITVGFGVIDAKGLKELPRLDLADKIILITVLVLTVFWQLVYAVGVGLVMAALVFLKRMSEVSAMAVVVDDLKKLQEEDPLWEDEITIPERIRDTVLFKHMQGPMFFGMVSEFRDIISELPEIHLLVIRMERVPFIDQSGVRALEMALDELHEQEVLVILSGPNENVLRSIRKMRIIPRHISEEHVFANFSECKIWLRRILDGEGSLEIEMERLKALR